MVKDNRVTYIEKWFKRAADADDAFDQFFYAWIALVVAAQILRTQLGIRPSDDTDGKRVADYFKVNANIIFDILTSEQETMLKLAQRRSSQWGNPIINTSKRVSEKLKKLSDHYVKNGFLTDEEVVKYTAELLNAIRNNLFHGIKVYDNKEDTQLLELANPLLLKIIRECENVAI